MEYLIIVILGIISALLLSNIINSKRKTIGYVYVLHSEHGYKIGKTKNVNQRMSYFGLKLPFKTTLVLLIQSDRYSELEKILHRKFESKRINGEWFTLNNKDLNYIKNLEY